MVPRIESPFHKPEVGKEHQDGLFIDSEEATSEQLKFIAKVKKMTGKAAGGDTNTLTLAEEAVAYGQDSNFTIPAKFSHVDIEALAETRTRTEELKEVLQRVHPWSSLHYGYSAGAIIEKL